MIAVDDEFADDWECGEDADCGNYNCAYHHGDVIITDDDDIEDEEPA